MPGLVGFAGKVLDIAEPKRVLQQMQDMITHEHSYVKDELFADASVCSTRSHINLIQRERQPYYKDGIYVWLDGEFCNRRELQAACETPAKSDTEILHVLFRQSRDLSFLADIDGYFCAAIYDTSTSKVHLITDRYGLRRLYWTVCGSLLVWSSELKAMLALPDFRPRIDPQAVTEFLNVGYLLENRTWFQGVELLPSATVLTWDADKGTIDRHRYWWWDQIKPFAGKIDEEQVVEELARLFIDAVERRSGQGERVGLTLSGGLDSRAILAAMPDRGYPVQVVTYGQSGCDDIRIAAMAAQVKGAVHRVVELGPDNWLMPRIKGVWWTDGELDLMHMHGIEAREVIKDAFDINLNGFAGDLILGGSYLQAKTKARDNSQSIAAFMGCDPSLIERFDEYSSLRTLDFYFLQNRVRRFTYCGTRHFLTSIEQRKPFYDNRLINFVYSLPDELRAHGRIYRLMLLSTFPDYYRHIPWQKTGACIGTPRLVAKVLSGFRRVRDMAVRGAGHIGIRRHAHRPRAMVDYAIWIRAEPARSFIDKILKNPDALYREYVQPQSVRDTWQRHLNGEDLASMVCRYLTFEIWLQQVFGGRYRPSADA